MDASGGISPAMQAQQGHVPAASSTAVGGASLGQLVELYEEVQQGNTPDLVAPFQFDDPGSKLLSWFQEKGLDVDKNFVDSFLSNWFLASNRQHTRSMRRMKAQLRRWKTGDDMPLPI